MLRPEFTQDIVKDRVKELQAEAKRTRRAAKARKR
ncbi:hypothetical protein ACRB68_48880 [Actinomadura sp. RB68]|uniref:Uncharacterized protein n=1 Tax=Actinomadura macrotermitis TaxID=2585200 RepID=A0A7K0C040_9ACTN|nr:hypothetical protein [Actinomadura macrotermitis]MQY06792.1 hypothetical protein [Actinomadura macrotermitis]